MTMPSSRSEISSWTLKGMPTSRRALSASSCVRPTTVGMTFEVATVTLTWVPALASTPPAGSWPRTMPSICVSS